MTPSLCGSCGSVVDERALNGLCAVCLLAAVSEEPAIRDSVQLEPGCRLGPYDIVSTLGVGGMGQVYLAWDTRLCRTVAIKVFAARFGADTERTRRLEREARIVAGLNHPRICAVYDIGCEQGLTYIVMEHLDGETLAARLARGPLPLDEVLKVGMQMADGLDRAHRHGITHRDLKPANIMLTPSGVKLLDFGLAARSYERGRQSSDSSSAADHISGLGGTIQYMAPEQLEWKNTDVRSDVFSFGLILREMLTAQPAFAAANREALIEAVVAANPPPLAALRPDVPPALERIVHRCLRKDPEERWQSLRDVLLELADIGAGQADPISTQTHEGSDVWWRRPRTLASVGVAMLATCAAVGALVAPTLAGDIDAPAIRFAASMPLRVQDLSGRGDLAFVSPDGRSFVWVSANGEGKTVLAVQALDSGTTTILPDTDGAGWPFWSPDSRAVAFFARGELRRVNVSGGPVEVIAKAPSAAGGAWSPSGTILFARDRSGPLFAVSEHGGEPRPVTVLDRERDHRSHLWPAFLPDGRHFVFFASSGRPEHRGLYLGQLDSPHSRWLGAADGAATWAPPRHLLFTRGSMLVAQAFDLTAMALVGEPHVLQPRVCGSSGIVPPCFSASTTGVLVYHVARLFRHQFAWFSRTGRQVAVPIEPGSYLRPVLSSDDRRVALERHDPQTWQLGIWQFDLGRQVLSRVVDAPTPATGPLWAPDGRALAFTSNVEARHAIYIVNTDDRTPRQIFAAPRYVLLTDWSSDRRLLFQTRGDATNDDVWMLPEQGHDAVAILQSRFNERQARLSPDSRWVAYCSDESGPTQVYVQRFPPTGAKWQISNDGGCEPTWRRDGRELFYLSGDRQLMAVAVQLGHDLTVGRPSALFRVPPDAPIESRSYAPSADGQRFLVNIAAHDRVRLPLFETQVIVNWMATLHE